MNDRFNNSVKDAHKETFAWLFGESDGDPDSTVYSKEIGGLKLFQEEPHYFRKAREEIFDNFSEWLNSDSSKYWISGKPSAGKSTLMKYICGRASRPPFLAEAIVLHYFFWYQVDKDPMQRTIFDMLSTLLDQLLEHRPETLPCLYVRMPEAHLKNKNEQSDWKRVELTHESKRPQFR